MLQGLLNDAGWHLPNLVWLRVRTLNLCDCFAPLAIGCCTRIHRVPSAGPTLQIYYTFRQAPADDPRLAAKWQEEGETALHPTRVMKIWGVMLCNVHFILINLPPVD